MPSNSKALQNLRVLIIGSYQMGSILEFLLFESSHVLTRVDATKDDGAKHTASRGGVPVRVFCGDCSLQMLKF